MTATRRLTRILTAVIALGIITATAACADPTDTAGSSAPTATAPIAGPTPTPASSEPPAAPTCENIISADSVERIIAHGLQLTPSAEYAEKIRSEGMSQLYLFADNGGVLCPWSESLEYSVAYAFSPISADQAATVEADLESHGYVSSLYAGGTIYTDLTGYDPLWSHYLFLDGYWFAGTGVELIDELVLTAPR